MVFERFDILALRTVKPPSCIVWAIATDTVGEACRGGWEEEAVCAGTRCRGACEK